MAISLDRILEALTLGEDKDWEFQSAKGGLPGNMWGTYSSPHKAGSLPHSASSLPRSVPNQESLMADLARIVSQFHEGERRTPKQIRQIVLELCRGRFLSLTQIAQQLERSEKGVRDRFITKMRREGLLESKCLEPTHPDQAHTIGKYSLNAESPS